ncbi:MAG: NAD(P)H-hydrate dehydratase [Oscillospiraceae bacterium]|nr:NAD(P)H-hydrate dehydratase [Oscillospiraceae bacterium]
MKALTAAQYAEKYQDQADVSPDICLREITPDDCRLPQRARVSHKYSYGRALIVAGARGYSGAPVLAANACERSGAGLTQLMVPESIYPIAAARCDGAVVLPLLAAEDGGFAAAAANALEGALQKANALAIGPGIGAGSEAKMFAGDVLCGAHCPTVADADALRVFADDPGLLDSFPAPLILTPHEGEFKRLGGDLTQGRLAGALRFIREHPRVILILKGSGTLVCREKEIAVNPTGGPAMAKGGSGDVLTGVLCALLAQGFDAWFAACAAVYLHGLAGDRAAKALGAYCLAPSDLITHLPGAFHELTE